MQNCGSSPCLDATGDCCESLYLLCHEHPMAVRGCVGGGCPQRPLWRSVFQPIQWVSAAAGPSLNAVSCVFCSGVGLRLRSLDPAPILGSWSPSCIPWEVMCCFVWVRGCPTGTGQLGRGGLREIELDLRSQEAHRKGP